MLFDYEIRRSSRRCSVSDQEIGPGEIFYSALVEREQELLRLDFSEAEWKSPPEGCIGSWKTQVPQLEKGKIYWAPRPVLIACIDQLLQQPEKSELAYVMALSLIRKRILKLMHSETDESNTEWITVSDPQSDRQYRLKVRELSTEQIETAQQELAELLFTDAPPEPNMDEN